MGELLGRYNRIEGINNMAFKPQAPRTQPKTKSFNTPKESMAIPIDDDILDSVIDQGTDEGFNKKDPILVAFAGKKDTCKSGVIAELISHLPEGKIAVIMDFDHSMKPIAEEYFKIHMPKFLFINCTAFGKEYRRSLMVGLKALERTVDARSSDIGVFCIDGADRIKQRSFKSTLQARGISIEDVSFFGKGGDKEFSPMDWMVRNDFNIDPFNIVYDYAAQLGVDIIVSTHTRDDIDQSHKVIEEDVPIWHDIADELLYYTFITKRITKGYIVTRNMTCKKARIKGDVYGDVHTILTHDTLNKTREFHGVYDYLKKNIEFPKW